MQSAKEEGPDKLETERRACLRGCRHRSDLKEATNAGDDAERDFKQLLHGFGVKYLA